MLMEYRAFCCGKEPHDSREAGSSTPTKLYGMSHHFSTRHRVPVTVTAVDLIQSDKSEDPEPDFPSRNSFVTTVLRKSSY